jgi:hypothetical protein
MNRRTKATCYLANIREENFETFRRNLEGDLTDSYRVWQLNLAKRVAALQR